jgi:hypothetical protein
MNFLWWHWHLNSVPMFAMQAHFPLEPLCSLLCDFFFGSRFSRTICPLLALTHDPPDFCLPSQLELYIEFLWFIFFQWEQGLKSGIPTCKTGGYHLSHNSSPLCSGYFGYGVSGSTCLGWPWTMMLPMIVTMWLNIVQFLGHTFKNIYDFLLPE